MLAKSQVKQESRAKIKTRRGDGTGQESAKYLSIVGCRTIIALVGTVASFFSTTETYTCKDERGREL